MSPETKQNVQRNETKDLREIFLVAYRKKRQEKSSFFTYFFFVIQESWLCYSLIQNFFPDC